MKKNRFMQKLNHSYREGGLTCGFNDYQLAEYIQQKRRKLPKVVVKVGPLKMGHGYWDLTSISTPMGKQYNTTEWIWLQRWCAAQLSISLEILLPLEHLLCLTHLCIQPQNWHADYPTPSTLSTLQNSKIIDGLSTTTHVFIRHDAVRKPILQIVLSHQKDW